MRNMNRRNFLKISSASLFRLTLPYGMAKHPYIEYAVNNFKINDWQHGVIPYKPYKHHEELAQIWDNNKLIIVNKYRQGGFSTFLVLRALYECIHKENQKFLFLHINDSAASRNKEILDFAIGHLPNNPNIIRNNSHFVEFKNGSMLWFGTPISGCGRSFNYIIFDEAAYMHDLEQWWKAYYPTISLGGKALIVSNPNGDNYFYELYQGALDKKNKFYPYHPNYKEFFSEEKILEMRKNVGEIRFLREFEGCFIH